MPTSSEPCGIPGISFFDCEAHKLPEGKRLFFDGVDWTGRAFRADLAQGWADAYDVDEQGKFVIPLRSSRHYGKIEVR